MIKNYYCDVNLPPWKIVVYFFDVVSVKKQKQYFFVKKCAQIMFAIQQLFSPRITLYFLVKIDFFKKKKTVLLSLLNAVY